MVTAARVALPTKGRSQARYWHGALLHRPASCQQRACFASSKVSRFMTPTVPPTGADANDFYGVSAPNVVPFVVTSRTEYEIAPVVCRWFVSSLPRAVPLVGLVGVLLLMARR